MLDNIHAHWKRRRVCKIKCKGVCTVDMDNVCQQLEVRVYYAKLFLGISDIFALETVHTPSFRVIRSCINKNTNFWFIVFKRQKNS